MVIILDRFELQTVIPSLWIIRIFPSDKGTLFGYVKDKVQMIDGIIPNKI